MDTVEILGARCMLQFGYYPNHTVGITAITKSDGDYWAVVTINYEDDFQGPDYVEQMEFPVVIIKNYGENKGVYQTLLDAGVISLGPYLSGSNGGVQMGTLIGKWVDIAREQLVRNSYED